GPYVEDGRNKRRASDRIPLRTALVLVSNLADFGAEWRGNRLSAERVDLLAGCDRCAQHLHRNERGMAPFRYRAPRISSRKTGRTPAFRKPVFCRWHGKLCRSGSDWEIRFPNLWRRPEVSNECATGRKWVWRLSEADSEPQRL